MKNLVKRNYLGEGYVHQYKNNTTGEVILVACSAEEYNAIKTTRAPELTNFTWQGSTGGTYKVDTENGVLGLDEYCELPDGKQVVRLDYNGKLQPEVVLDIATIKGDAVDETIVSTKIEQDKIQKEVIAEK